MANAKIETTNFGTKTTQSQVKEADFTSLENAIAKLQTYKNQVDNCGNCAPTNCNCTQCSQCNQCSECTQCNVSCQYPYYHRGYYANCGKC